MAEMQFFSSSAVPKNRTCRVCGASEKRRFRCVSDNYVGAINRRVSRDFILSATVCRAREVRVDARSASTLCIYILSDAWHDIKAGEIGARTLVTLIRVDREQNVQLWWNIAPPHYAAALLFSIFLDSVIGDKFLLVLDIWSNVCSILCSDILPWNFSSLINAPHERESSQLIYVDGLFLWSYF